MRKHAARRTSIGVVLLFLAVPVGATERSESLITVEELRSHVATLAADSFEGREAGHRGGHAAAAYLLSEVRRLDVQPAGEEGTFLQSFGNDYRNVLALIPGSDEALKGEVIVVGAHFDHVGYGAKGNSFGPLGQIHNGADDNASGTAALLELAESFAVSTPKPKRTLLFAFWDAEEKGLLGSEHWLAQPTVPGAAVKFAFNFDMLGRMRDRTVEIYGVRTAVGLRRILSSRNVETDLILRFDWSQREDSDHWSFFKRDVPYLMLHSGLHDEYHRPADDTHLINLEGLHAITVLSRGLIADVANAPSWTFRAASRSETNETNRQLCTPLPQPAARFGVRWHADLGERGEFLVTEVIPDSPAAIAGLAVGDRITRFNGTQPLDTASLRTAVLAAEAKAEVTIARNGQEKIVPIHLKGAPVHVGFSWRVDDAEPSVVIIRRVVAGSPADVAGLRVGDRILSISGRDFADETTFRAVFRDAGEAPELTIERNGRVWHATLHLTMSRFAGASSMHFD